MGVFSRPLSPVCRPRRRLTCGCVCVRFSTCVQMSMMDEEEKKIQLIHLEDYLRRLHPSGSIQRIVIIIEALLFSWIFWFILCGFFFQLSMLFSIDSLQLYDENDSFFPALRAVQRILIVLADIGMLGALR